MLYRLLLEKIFVNFPTKEKNLTLEEEREVKTKDLHQKSLNLSKLLTFNYIWVF